VSHRTFLIKIQPYPMMEGCGATMAGVVIQGIGWSDGKGKMKKERFHDYIQVVSSF